MNNEYAKHETDYIEEYQKKGYDANFRIDQGRLKSSGSEKDYAAKDVTIHGEHRFEGMSNPSDLSILYALETNDGTKGIVLCAYGPSADIEIHEFIESIPKSKNDVNKNEPPKK